MYTNQVYGEYKMGHVNAESLEKLNILDKFDIAIRRGVARALWEHKKMVVRLSFVEMERLFLF